MVPARIVPFRMVRTEHFILLTLPAIASFNTMVLVESNRLNLLRLRLRLEVRALRFDLLHLLRSRLLHLGPCISLRVLLASCRSRRSCAGFCHRLLHTLTLLSLPNLLISAVRRHSRLTTRHIRPRRGSICRFLLSPTLSAFSSTRLIRRLPGRFRWVVRFWGVRRFVALMSFLAPFRARLIRGRALIHRAAFLHCAGLPPRSLLRLGRVRARLCLSRVRFFRGALAL